MSKHPEKPGITELRRIIAGSALALGLATGSAMAAPVLQIKSQAGQTLLGFDNGFLQALTAAGIEVDAIKPGKAKSKGRGISLPVTGGIVDLDGFVGQINHSGGIRLTAFGGDKVRLHNLSIVLFDGQPLIYGAVQLNGDLLGVRPLFVISLDENSDIYVQRNGKLITENLLLSLTQEASDLLNTELAFFQAPGEDIAGADGRAKLRNYKPDDDSEDSEELQELEESSCIE